MKYFKSYKTNIFTQIYWLLFRNLLSVARDPFLFKMQIIQAIVSDLK